MSYLPTVRELLENWPTKLLAAVIAVALWFYVLGAENPQATRTLTLPVVGENVPEGLAVISITPQQAEVRVRGRTMRFEQTDFARMRLRADLTGAKLGEQTVPLTVAGLPVGLQVLPGHPISARIRLDKLIQRTRPVQVIKLGEPSQDFAVEDIKVTPTEVIVRGATSIVARVARVAVVVDVSGLNSNQESEAELEARDLRDVVVNGLEFEPARVTVQVTVRPLNTRTVPVRPIIGPTRSGYSISWVRVEPPVVTLTGEGDVLADVESVATGRIDVSGLTGRKTYAVSLNVPEGVTALGGASVNVTVSVRRPGSGGGAEEREEPPTPETENGAAEGGTEGDDGEPAPGEESGEGASVEPPATGTGDTPAPGTDDSDSTARPASRGVGGTN